jgi:RNA polymerase sigma factor (sigma-70 family)
VAFVRRLGYSLEDAKDAAAQAMTDACCRWQEINEPRPWVRVAARRIALYEARHRRAGVNKAIRVWAESRHEEVDQLYPMEGRLRVLALLDCLPDQQREVMAWYLDGYETQEIARHLGISDATVRSHKRHARSLLIKRLGDLRGSGAEGGQP